MNTKRFITNSGAPFDLVRTGYGDDGNVVSQETTSIGRYGVWEERGRGKPECFDTGDDLAVLQAQYGPGLTVYSLSPLETTQAFE